MEFRNLNQTPQPTNQQANYARKSIDRAIQPTLHAKLKNNSKIRPTYQLHSIKQPNEATQVVYKRIFLSPINNNNNNNNNNRQYSFGILDWKISELKRLTQKHASYYMHNMQHPNIDVERRYIPRKDGGEGPE